MTRALSTEIAAPFVALLLAAGEGARLGRVPKSLLRLGVQTLLERQIIALKSAGASLIVVVTGHFFKDIEAELDHVTNTLAIPIKIVRHAQPEQGQQSSVLLGLSVIKALDTKLPVLIALADQPLMEASDYRHCMQSFHNRPLERSILYPVVNQQRGNPVVLTQPVMERVLASGLTCREFIGAHPEQVHHFSTYCDHYIFDIDALEDLEKFRQRTGMMLSLPPQQI